MAPLPIQERQLPLGSRLIREGCDDRRIRDSSKAEDERLSSAGHRPKVVRIERPSENIGVARRFRFQIQVLKSHLPSRKLSRSCFPAQGPNGVVAWICLNCMDDRFDDVFRALDDLEEALVSIEEKARKASSSIVAPRFLQQIVQFFICHRTRSSTPVRQGDHLVHKPHFGASGFYLSGSLTPAGPR